MLLKAALVLLALAVLFFGLSFAAVTQGSDTASSGRVAYLLMWVCGGMALFSLIGILVRISI